MARKVLSAIYQLVESLTLALAVFAVLYLFLARPAEVQGSSSHPTLETGERVMVEKIIPEKFIERGDFIVIQSPFDPNVDFIKRVIGLPGEMIRLSSGRVYINGRVLPEPYLPGNTYTGAEKFLAEEAAFLIPSSSYFVLGDNRMHSLDSRDFGPIPFSSVRGKVLFRFWPLEKFGPVVK